MSPRTLVAVLFSLLILCAGCGYKAQVRGITTPDQVDIVSPGAKVCVELYPDSEAGELAANVGSKLERLLTEKGYTVTAARDADFFLLYDYDIKTLMNRVRIEPIFGVRTGIRTAAVKGPFDQTLSLRLVEAGSYRENGMEEYVWAGGALLDNIPTPSPRFLDLLLVAGLRHFPNDTGEVLEIKMHRNDAQARVLREEWYPESEVSQN